MNWLSKLDVFTVGFTVWKLIGEDIYFTSKKTVLFRVINCLVMATIIVFILSNLIKAEGEIYVKTLENFTSIFHVRYPP